MGKIDVERCWKAMRDVTVKGDPTPENRRELIAEAISQIETDGNTALSRSIGFKDHGVGISEHRCDCEYGYEPKHGRVVFEIGRALDAPSSEDHSPLGPDHVYLLERVRDFGSKVRRVGDWTVRGNLCCLISEYMQMKKRTDEIRAMIEDKTMAG